jgi:outer membrane protein OmpA-like peptidoglycan-associated protein
MTQSQSNISYALLAVALAASLLYRPVTAADPEPLPAQAVQPRAEAVSQPLQQDFDALMSEIEARQPAQDAPPTTGAGEPAGTVEEQLNAARIQIGILQQAVIAALGARAEAEVQLEKLWRNSRGEINALKAAQSAGATRIGALERELARAKGVSGEPGVSQVARAAPAAAVPMPDDAEPTDASGAASLAQAAGPAEVMLNEIHFNPGSATLTPGGERKALEAAEKIKSLGASNVRVSGYTDTQGPAAYNMHLSLRRARSIADLLESVGVSAESIAVEGHGEEGGPEPTADQVSEPLNRCAGIFAMVDLPAGQAQP